MSVTKLPIQLYLLGAMQLHISGERSELPSRKSRALLAYVAVAETAPARDDLVYLFCPQAADPRRALRTLLSRLRRLSPDLIVVTGERVGLGTDVWVDCHEFAAVVGVHSRQSEAVAMYRGPFLNGMTLPDSPEFEMWLLGQRTRFQRRKEEALLSLIDKCRSEGSWEVALTYAQALLVDNPFMDAAHAHYIATLSAIGRRREALAHYEKYCLLLEREIGVAPTQLLSKMVATIRAPESAAPFVKEKTEPAGPTLLPRPIDRIRSITIAAESPARRAIYRRWMLATAEVAIDMGAYDEAQTAYKTLLESGDSWLLNGRERTEYTLRLALLADYLDTPLEAHQAQLAQATAGLEAAPDSGNEALFLLACARLRQRQAHYAAAIALADKAFHQLRELGENGLAGRALIVRGESQLRTGCNREAEAAFAKARSLCTGTGDWEGIALSAGGVARSAINRGEITRAFAGLDKVLAEVGPRNNWPAEARLHYTLAAAYNYVYDTEAMAASSQRAHLLYRRMGHHAMAWRSLLYSAQADRYDNNFAAARRRFGALFQAAQVAHDTWLSAWVMAIFGGIAFRQGKLSEAESWFDRAYGLRQETGERQNQVYDLAWRGRLLAAQGRLPQALHYTRTAVQQMEAAATEYMVWEPWDIYMAHAEILHQMGDDARGGHSLANANRALQMYVAGINQQQRDRVLAHDSAWHVAEAWLCGKITPFHDREHRFI